MDKAKMFNEDVKLKFATEAVAPPSNKDHARRIFLMTAEREAELQKDLYQWDRKEVIDFLEKKGSISYNTQKGYIFGINAYMSWANNNFTPIAFSEIDYPTVYRNHTYSSPEDFQKTLDNVYDPVAMNSSGILYRSMVWLYYMGLPVDAMFSLENSNIDIKNKLVSYDGVLYSIPDEAIITFSKCKTLKSFMTYTANIYQMDRADSELFLRQTKIYKDVKTRIRKISQLAVIKFRNKDIEYSVSAIRRSGVFYRMYQLEKEGIVPNYLQAYLDFAEGASERIRRNRQSVYISSTKIEYEAWKQAFYPETKI